MLVLTRRTGERLKVGPNITIIVTRIDQGSVRIAVDAPRHITIVREELTVKK